MGIYMGCKSSKDKDKDFEDMGYESCGIDATVKVKENSGVESDPRLLESQNPEIEAPISSKSEKKIKKKQSDLCTQNEGKACDDLVWVDGVAVTKCHLKCAGCIF